MKHTLSQKRLRNCLCLFFLFFISTSYIFAQNVKTSKKPVKKIQPKAAVASNTSVIVLLKEGVVVNMAAKTTDTVDGSLLGLANIKLSISGKTPANDVPVIFTITDYSNASPAFYPVGSSVNYTTSISKNSFHANGSPDSVSIPVIIKYKKAANTSGAAFVKINGQSEFVKLDFDVKAPPKISKGLSVTLLDSNTVIQLDTFKKNTATQFPIKLYFKLSKGVGADTYVKIVTDPVGEMTNIKLSEDNTNKTFLVKVLAAEWNSKKDTVISRNINLYTRQLSPITGEHDIILHIDTGKDRHIVKLMPSKVRQKNRLIRPIAPENIEIVSSKVAFSHYSGTTVNSIDTIHINVRVFGKYNPSHNQVSFTLLDTALTKHFQIMEDPITIGERDWNGADSVAKKINVNVKKKIKDTVAKEIIETGIKKDSVAESMKSKLIIIPLHIRTINLNDSLNDIQYLDIIIKGQAQVKNGSQRVEVSKKDQPFWAEIGTNFDLLDNLKTNNFYAGVFMFDKDIGRFRLFNFLKRKRDRKKDENNVSFTGGVYESQSVSLGSTSNSGFTYRNGNSYVNIPNKGYQIYRDTGSVNTTTTIKSIGIFVSPHIRLTNGKIDEDGVHLFLSIYAELLWQRVSTSFDYSKTSPLDTSNVNYATMSTTPFKANNLTLDYRSQYYGIGIPIYIKHADFNLYINWIPLGFTTQQFVFVQNNYTADYNNKYPYRPIAATDGNYNYNINLLNYARPRRAWNAFYIFQYRLNEVAYGITFSGEIRSLFLNGSKPVVTLALSKKFDLSEVLKPIVGKF